MEADVKALIDGIDEGVGKRLDTFGSGFDAKLAEIEEKLTPKAEDPGPAPEKAMEGITKMEFWDIPIGQALVGGFSAVVASELVDGFFAAQQPMTLGVIKLAGAGVLAKWGDRLLGSTGSKAAAIILAYDGIRQIIPLDEWAGRLTGAVTTRTGAGLAGKAGMTGGSGSKAGTTDYYAGLYGGGR